MTPYYDDGQAAFYLGDVREVLVTLPSESVNCIVTSPPYWGLRRRGMLAQKSKQFQPGQCSTTWIHQRVSLWTWRYRSRE